MTPGEFSRLWHRHRTIREVAAAAGMAPSRAHALARSLGLKVKRRTRAKKPEDLALIAEIKFLRDEGLTFRRIAAIVGKGLGFVHKHGRDV